MTDANLAELYGFSAEVWNLAIKRNVQRIPPDLMFLLSPFGMRGGGHKLRTP